ncbi:MAG: restriction endonuclease subunit S [Chitinophagaceae bacterium]
MSKNNEKKLVPNYRFPEFVNYGEWSYPNGDELFEPIVNKNHNSDLPILAITQEQGAIPRDIIDYHVSVTEKSVESYKVVEVGDFIISLRSFQGGIEYSNYKGLCSPAYIILRKKVEIENDFYRHYFKSVPFIRDLNKNLEGIRDGKMISYKQFSEILIPKPKPKEQQKIAACLSSLDEVITAESKKLEVLKEHKKGLLQHLFPQAGETLPKLRFKEFEDSGEWEVKKLGEVVTFTGGGTPSKSKPDFWQGNIPWISSSDIEEDSIHKIKVTRFITEEALKESATKLVPANSVLLVSRVGVGKLAVSTEPLCTSQDFTSFSPIDDNSIFLGYYLKSKREILLSFSQGMAIKGFTKDDISKLELLIPSISEQQKIASVLSSIDEIIIAKGQKIEALQLHKKGLLQGLFPNINNIN